MPNFANILNNIVSDSNISTTAYKNGTSGASGLTGTLGTSGVSSANGTSGIATANGSSGVSGTARTSGVSGTAGTSGSSGTAGTSGVSGTARSSGVSGVSNTGSPGANGSSGGSATNTLGGTPFAYVYPYYTASATFANAPLYYTQGNVSAFTTNGYFSGGGNFYTESPISVLGRLRCSQTYFDSVTGRNLVWENSSGKFKYLSSLFAHKKNINELIDISWIDNLRPVSYNYKVVDEKQNITNQIEDKITMGFIAEELDLLQPALVVRVNDEIQSLKHKELLIPLLAKVKELEERIKVLKSKA